MRGRRYTAPPLTSKGSVVDRFLQLLLYHFIYLSESTFHYPIGAFRRKADYNNDSLSSREVSISFSHVELEEGTQRTLILKHPDRYIPQFMEELSDINLVLCTREKKKSVAIEVINIKSYTLRLKLKSHVDIEDINLLMVTEAHIEAKSPAFLLEELRKQFIGLKYNDNYDMKQNLCQNIEFIFGPPGTGKTTYLARNTILPLVNNYDKLRILVLTPTNKSADVLVKRIMDVMSDDTSYEDWLVRFGSTVDESIEQSKVFREKIFDIQSINKSVVVSTIARFPYDFFMSQNKRLYLRELNWDYIIIDEASMIPIANIVYVLYKKTPQKFIIAGDPFQIEPITSVDLWRNQNIYEMVGLKSFAMPKTEPHEYKVTTLTTQYRSIPSVGNVFSKLTYNGILENYRKEDDRVNLNIEDKENIKTLNIIKFPISKYESIYRPKRLQKSSSYQLYSALFTFEYVLYLSRIIAEKNKQKIRIGIIAPYRAQADLIDKLVASEKFPKSIDIQVGTIHGFQGDECEMIFAVFNTPPTISANKDMFLNKQNIINVSISRARDYLFIVMPDNNTENIENLKLVNRVESIIKKSGEYSERLSPDIEQIIFNSSTYLEDNSFSTGHQSVNVYGLPEKCYEIRSEDTSVDVQIHRPSYTSMVNSMIAPPTPPKKTEVLDSEFVAKEVYLLNTKPLSCPFDKGVIEFKTIPMRKKGGSIKKPQFLVCKECKRIFYADNCKTNANISDYDITINKSMYK